MLKESDILKDDFLDDVLPTLRLLNKRKSWNTESRLLKDKLCKALVKKGNKCFVSSPTRYFIQKVGASFLCDVPMYRRGHLSDFRGMRVRIVCIGSGRGSNRTYMAGVVAKTPPEKLLTKRKFTYVFPDIGDHSIAYKSRRYILIKTDGKFEIEEYQGSFDYIDLDSWDYILFDGKHFCPIATLKSISTDRLEGKLIGDSLTSSYQSIKEAIKSLSKSFDWRAKYYENH